jgi:hypothetical protein
LAPRAAIFSGIAQIESKSLQDFSGKFLEMQDDIHSSCRLAAALIAGLIAIVVNTAMLEASRCRHGCFQDGFHILVGLLMAVFYAFVLEPVLAGSALVKGLVYALLVWRANAFITLPWIGKSPLSFDVAESTFCGFLTISGRGPQ